MGRNCGSESGRRLRVAVSPDGRSTGKQGHASHTQGRPRTRGTEVNGTRVGACSDQVNQVKIVAS